MTTPNIFPALRYHDGKAALDWLAEGFGFEQVVAIPGDDGTISHAEMRLGAGTIMFGSARDDATAPGVYIAVDDIDAHYDRARAAGAEITYELTDQPYGSREYGARDPEGHHWYFGTYRPS